MTIVLQHQFWDLVVADEPGQAADGSIRIGLSFGGVPSTLVIPIAALTAFADPHARFGARFGYAPPPVPGTPDDPEAAPTPLTPEAAEPPQVVSLDAFRRRTPPRET
jgi:hypothetical protein